MNQSLIINDDLTYISEEHCWQCTLMLSGEKITIIIKSDISPENMTQDIKFDWEALIEDWFDDHEPTNSQVEITI